MLPLQHHQYNHDVLVVRGVWIATGALQFALLSRARLLLGRTLLGRWLVVAAAAAIGLGVLRGSQQYGYPGHSLWSGRIGMSDLQVAFVLAALLVLTALLTRTGRVALPVAGGLATLLLGLRYFTLPGYFGPVEIGPAQAALMAFLAFIALRLLVAVAARTAGRTRLGSGHDRDFDPPSA